MAGDGARRRDAHRRPLTPETWDAFAGLAERHNGVWGGCWCTWFHTFHAEKEFSYDANRALKERLVREGRAHAGLVFDGDVAVGWCQFGSPDELKNIKHRKEYDAELGGLGKITRSKSSTLGSASARQ